MMSVDSYLKLSHTNFVMFIDIPHFYIVKTTTVLKLIDLYDYTCKFKKLFQPFSVILVIFMNWILYGLWFTTRLIEFFEVTLSGR